MIMDAFIAKFIIKSNNIFDTETYTRDTLLVFSSVLIIVIILQWLLKQLNEINKLPPGPWGLPILGYLTFMGNEKHTQYMKMAKKYGSLFSTRLGNQLTIVISDYKVLRDAFKKEEFTGRPQTPLLQTICGFGIINSEGTLWKDQRRFLHDKLRHFGMTYMGNKKQLMETRIMTEVNDFLGALGEAKTGEAVDLNPLLALSASNVICNILMSLRFKIDDPKFQRFNFLIEEGFRLFGEILTIDYIPTIQYLPGTVTTRNKIAKNREEMFEFYREVIEDHRKTFDANNIRDLIDTYIMEINLAKKEGRENELFEGKNPDVQIMQVLSDLFSAGMETIKSTLLWINVFMLRHPDAMRRVQNELDEVVGRNRLPKIEDVPYLPVTESIILEVMRISSIVPLATTHTPSRDVSLNGFKIPAGSQIVPLISSVHMDPKLWDKPEEFNPSRFINSEGKVRKPEYFIPFGVGRRMCLGNVLARMEIFLFFSSLMHTFTISLPEGAPMPSLKGNVGVTIAPAAFKICLTPRPLHTDQTPIRNVGSY